MFLCLEATQVSKPGIALEENNVKYERDSCRRSKETLKWFNL
jgi:hypothetical protein